MKFEIGILLFKTYGVEKQPYEFGQPITPLPAPTSIVFRIQIAILELPIKKINLIE